MQVDRAVAAVGIGMWLAGCAHPTTAGMDATAAAATVDDLVARVNGQPITREAFAAAVERHMVRYRDPGHQLPPSVELGAREWVLRRMIEDTLLAQKAAELGLAVTDEEIDAAFVAHEQRFRSPAAFAEYLERSHQTADQVRAEVHRELVRALVVEALCGQVEVDETELRSYYAEHRARFVEREQIRASRIVMPISPGADPERVREAEQLAKTVRSSATRDPRSFSNLARKYSRGPQARRGGALGWFARGRMPPDWDRVAFAQEPGTISEPIQSEHGFEIVAVWEHEPERERPFAEVAEEIRQTLRSQKREERRRTVLCDLRATAHVELLIELNR